MTTLAEAVSRRRTFAIISHPDAGKTTLTEKLLLYAGAIQLAGAVKARGEARRARSDWMKVERERGISVSASVMTFEHEGNTFNLLDTPGHEDFSEDTYRTLTAVDSAVMVLDAAKGIETQTRKLFEVCRLRDMPITSFINKLDRDARDPFDLLDEIADTLQLEVAPMTWPVGMGRSFQGSYDLVGDRLILVAPGDRQHRAAERVVPGLDSPDIDGALGSGPAARLREEVEMVRELCPPFDTDAFLSGNRTPVYFGSALRSFGVGSLLDGLARHAPAPQPQQAAERTVAPGEDAVTGFVFKIQANMDPKHRDRIAFVRLCSGRFHRGIRLLHPRSGRTLNIHNPVLFLAQDRELAEEAWPGDIIGIPNHGNLRIGDALSAGEPIRFVGVPSFAPDLLRRVRPEDPLRAKHLGRALLQLAEEGVAQVFRTREGNDWIVGVAGTLQFDVLADRIRTEYEVPVRFESTAMSLARWIEADDDRAVRDFMRRNEAKIAHDHNGAPLFLAANRYWLDRAAENAPEVRFLATREQAV
ncbi:MAG: peptide chain release factor 3 [Acidobacteria bacterium]|nr:peptide chain release factor 3 [Acidobacteriota bacterium]